MTTEDICVWGCLAAVLAALMAAFFGEWLATVYACAATVGFFWGALGSLPELGD